MLIVNWMQKDPVTINSDMTASRARELFNELKVPFLPVVDDGKLRGILARRDIRQAASFVTASQSVHEMNFFNTRMKVKDLMVRKPITLSIHDTVETALEKGVKLGRGFFPIMDEDKLVGTISDRDIFKTFYQILGVEEKLCGITVEGDNFTQVMGNDIVRTACAAGAALYSFFMLPSPETGKKRLLLRLRTSNLSAVVDALREKGYRIVEVIDRSEPVAA
ncbi:PpsC: phenylphosphate synthetase activity stimulating protein [Syntrophobacter sp. SbD1]|nr:PpsC: phenylphosphate synthetase activity stimulating protein [Syntrophobacter sp. SbD1]